MSPDLLREILPLLTAAKVKQFKLDNLEIVFHVEQSKEADGKSTEQLVEAMRKQEESLPPDLRTDFITNYDAVMNWSGSPENSAVEMPLAGDQPL